MGANVNWKDEYEYASLHKASLDGYFDILKVLIENGGNVNIQVFFFFLKN